MEDNQTQNYESDNSKERIVEPVNTDNSSSVSDESSVSTLKDGNEGESLEKDPSKQLLLGKFKSVEDLSKAYEELQKYQGQCSDELGYLRRETAAINEFKRNMDTLNSLKGGLVATIAEAKKRYDTPEYFQDPTFREIYKEALLGFGENLDSDRLVNLIESYVKARIFAHEKQSAAEKETQKILDSMSYNKNPKTTTTKPKKSLDEMTEAEVNEMLDRLV